MRFSTLAILCSVFAVSSFASPVESPSLQNLEKEVLSTKRCCINCDNNRCGSNDKREAVETENEVHFKTGKRCCILCDNPYARCGGSSEKREAVETEHEALFGITKRDDLNVSLWPSKRCCINCDNPYARCGASDKRDVFESFVEAVEGQN